MNKWLTLAARDILAAVAPVIVAHLLAAIAGRPLDGDQPQGELPLADGPERSGS